jgi:hypothetical protein
VRITKTLPWSHGQRSCLSRVLRAGEGCVVWPATYLTEGLNVLVRAWAAVGIVFRRQPSFTHSQGRAASRLSTDTPDEASSAPLLDGSLLLHVSTNNTLKLSGPDYDSV